jgi:hypothetical protein
MSPRGEKFVQLTVHTRPRKQNPTPKTNSKAYTWHDVVAPFRWNRPQNWAYAWHDFCGRFPGIDHRSYAKCVVDVSCRLMLWTVYVVKHVVWYTSVVDPVGIDHRSRGYVYIYIYIVTHSI